MWEIILIAIAMSIDAFSVAFGVGCKYNKPRHYFRLSWHFGLFQFIMPLIGALTGKFLMNYTDNLNIIAALILFIIAFKMFKDSLKNNTDRCYTSDPTTGFTLIFLSVATSMDALGVGISLAFYPGNLLIPAFVIGIVCSIFTFFGVYLGSLSKHFIGKKAEYFGSIVLMFIGIKFLTV
jgi:putative Mn2+ efflux pump MntP